MKIQKMLWTLAVVLAATFTLLRLTGGLAWSWWWVLAPVIVPVGLVFAGGFLIVLACVIVSLAGGEIKVRGR